MVTLKEALFSRRNLNKVKDTYTIDEVIKEKLQIFVVHENSSLVFFDCYNDSYNQLSRGYDSFLYIQHDITKGAIKSFLKVYVKKEPIVYYNMIDYKNDISDIWKALEYFESESFNDYTEEDILNKVIEEAGAKLVEINIVK